jgi:hypothetical protein
MFSSTGKYGLFPAHILAPGIASTPWGMPICQVCNNAPENAKEMFSAFIHTFLSPRHLKKRNARTSSGVLLVFSSNGINVIKKLHICSFGWHRCNFLIKKITSMLF